MSSPQALTVVSNRNARLARFDAARRPRVVDHDLDVRVLAFLSSQPEGSALFGRLQLEFVGDGELGDSLARLEARRLVDRFDGCEFHITFDGRSRVEHPKRDPAPLASASETSEGT